MLVKSNVNCVNSVTNIKAVKAGKDYYATVNGERLRYILDNEAVQIIGEKKKYGGFYLSRFNGQLSPENIREFHKVKPK